MPDAPDSLLIRRLVGGMPGARARLLERAPTSDSTPLLVAAALVSHEPALLVRALHQARTTRDRQLVALAEAHLRGDVDLLDLLVREHLTEHPDNLLAAWIAGLPSPS